MTENRKIALRIAMGEYFTEEIDVEIYSKMSVEEVGEKITFWEPFEGQKTEYVQKQINGLADVIEISLNIKDVYGINDTVITECLVNDLEGIYGYSKEEATDWVEERGEKVISEMWDGYTNYLEQYVEDKTDD